MHRMASIYVSVGVYSHLKPLAMVSVFVACILNERNFRKRTLDIRMIAAIRLLQLETEISALQSRCMNEEWCVCAVVCSLFAIAYGAKQKQNVRG